MFIWVLVFKAIFQFLLAEDFSDVENDAIRHNLRNKDLNINKDINDHATLYLFLAMASLFH